MPAWSSSSLAASDTKSKGLLSGRKSKQLLMEKKMFRGRKGSHGKDFQIGKKFKVHGKGTGLMKAGSMKSGGISPSTNEFDKMLSSVTHNPNKKKSMFSRKQFG